MNFWKKIEYLRVERMKFHKKRIRAYEKNGRDEIRLRKIDAEEKRIQWLNLHFQLSMRYCD